jgi:hypothetical protein
MSWARSIEGSATKRNNCTSRQTALRALFRPVRNFAVHPWLKNPHLMTVVAECWPRNLSAIPQSSERLAT